jgi:hypothetical protein
VRIPLGSYDDETIKPAWLPIANYSDGTPHKPVIRCACGKLFGLGLHHVHADGRVTASFYHPVNPGDTGSTDREPGCGFHEFLELDGYTTHPTYAGREFLPERE